MLNSLNGASLVVAPEQRNDCRQVSRLIAAAIINQGFRELLLRDAALAISRGFNGESFDLDSDAHNMLISIRARNLGEFARQIAEYLRDSASSRKPSTSPNGGPNGNGHSHVEPRTIG